MADLLPTIPRVVFSQLEPLSLVAGFLAPILAPTYFIGSQLPTASLSIAQEAIVSGIVVNDPTAKLISWQLGNCYLLLGLVGVFILNTTTELKVVRAYLFALWLGDIGHLGITAYAMGTAGLMDVGGWNSVIWGNLGATLALFVLRSLYLQGFFDTDAPSKSATAPATKPRAKTHKREKSK